MLAAHGLFSRPLPFQSALASGKGNTVDLIQDGGKSKRQKEINHHSPKHSLIICHLRDLVL
jgi:hypothetical protein